MCVCVCIYPYMWMHILYLCNHPCTCTNWFFCITVYDNVYRYHFYSIFRMALTQGCSDKLHFSLSTGSFGKLSKVCMLVHKMIYMIIHWKHIWNVSLSFHSKKHTQSLIYISTTNAGLPKNTNKARAQKKKWVEKNFFEEYDIHYFPQNASN